MKKIVFLNVSRNIHMEDLRRVCIDNNYYTRGDVVEYDNLLNMAGALTEEKLIAIAEDIFNHSDVDGACERYGVAEEDFMACIINDVLRASYTATDLELEEV